MRLVSLPNILLTWALHPSVQSALAKLASDTSGPEDAVSNADATSITTATLPQPGETDDVEITTDLIAAFKSDLAARGIKIQLIAGAWSDEFVKLASSSSSSSSAAAYFETLLVLASETIYSPAYIAPFTTTLLKLLGGVRDGADAKALVAAKKVYFGVGGGIDEFVDCVGKMGGRVVGERLDVQDGGVGRVVVEVRA